VTAEPRARVVRIRLKTQAAFPVSDDLSVPLLRLMAATNDTRQLQKLVLSTRDPARPPQGRSEALVQNGELLYYVRLFFGHLYEAGKAFRELDDRHRGRVDAMLASDKRAQAALATLRTVFRDRAPKGFDNEILVPCAEATPGGSGATRTMPTWGRLNRRRAARAGICGPMRSPRLLGSGVRRRIRRS
jgi:hypothetical protein